MEMHRARKGVLISASSYSADDLRYLNLIESKWVVLIDGETLADLMIDNDVGVAVAEIYLVKRLDNDFFEEGD
jgi:restriction system protein